MNSATPMRQADCTVSSSGQRARFALAKCLEACGCMDQAFRILAKLKAERCRLPGIDLLRAKCRLRQSLTTEAREMAKEELRLHPGSKEALAMIAALGESLPLNEVGYEKEFTGLLAEVGPYTMVGPARLHALYSAAKRICETNQSGHFVECGVAGGGSSALLAAVIKRYSKQPRRVFCFDTFEGMPPPTEADVHAGQPAFASGWADGTCAAPVESLINAATRVGARELVTPVKGLFADTLPAKREEVGPISLLHLDGDWYESTRDILLNLYDVVLVGGYLQADDYGYWEGCRRAIEEFEAERGLRFEKRPVDATGVWFLKP